MTKEQYIDHKLGIQEEIKFLEKKKEELKQKYIDANKPCDIDQVVTCVHLSGRKETMMPKTFGVFRDEVFITSFKAVKNGKEESTLRYISNGHGEVIKS